MGDLSMVKKIIISLMNLHPNGVAANKLERLYRNQEGHSIPFAEFSYLSLCSFLQEELANNIRIVPQGFDLMLYPIATGNSAHVIKMVSEQNQTKNTKRPTQKKYNIPSSKFQKNSITYNAHNLNQTKESTYHQRTQQHNPRKRSPTMPRLVEYRPCRKGLTNEQYDQMLQTILLQSQDAYLSRLREQNHHNERTSSENSRFVDRRSQLKEKVQRLGAKANDRQERSAVKNNMYTCVPQPSTSAMSLNHKPSTSNNLSTRSALKPTIKPKEDIVWDSSTENIATENVWDDDMEKAKPPLVNKANSDDYCGVSDIDNSALLATSEEVMREKMANCWFSDSEEEEVTDIKNIASEIHSGDVLPVRISDVNNPLKFWIHVRLPKYTKDINKLYKEMDEFYKLNRHSDEYKVTNPDEQGKLYFAAYYKDQWHRVEAIDTKMGESQKVSFIDHGTRDIINISDMRQLPKQFWKCPKAALCCALGNIKPKGKTFDIESADALIRMVDKEKKMYAKVLEVNYAKFKATIELVLDSDKRCVNDELVLLGHAIEKTVRANA